MYNDTINQDNDMIKKNGLIKPQLNFKGYTSVFNQDGNIYIERYKLDLFEFLKNKLEKKENPSVLLTELKNLKKELGQETCIKVKYWMKITLQDDPFINPIQKEFFSKHLFDLDMC